MKKVLADREIAVYNWPEIITFEKDAEVALASTIMFGGRGDLGDLGNGRSILAPGALPVRLLRRLAQQRTSQRRGLLEPFFACTWCSSTTGQLPQKPWAPL